MVDQPLIVIYAKAVISVRSPSLSLHLDLTQIWNSFRFDTNWEFLKIHTNDIENVQIQIQIQT